MRFVATATRGVEQVLADELDEIGVRGARPGRGAVAFEGELVDGLRACLHSRVASRVLLRLGAFDAPDADALYEGARAIPWADHLAPTGSLAVDFVGTSRRIRNSRFGALRVKDAVVDCLRDRRGARPSVDLRDPDLRVHCRLHRGRATVSVDLSGPPLFLRGLDRDGGPAPLKETLAAAILRIAGWPAAAREGRPLLDPLCGSGTFLSEAAAMAAGIAPGLARPRWGFDRWLGHDPAAWARLVDEARAAPRRPVPPVLGSDRDPDQVRRAVANLRRAGLDAHVQVVRREMEAARPAGPQPGLVVTNPPYGARMDPDRAAPSLRALGDVLRRHFPGWTAWILAGSPALGRQTGLKPARRIPLWNGRIECRLVELPIADRPPARLRDG